MKNLRMKNLRMKKSENENLRIKKSENENLRRTIIWYNWLHTIRLLSVADEIILIRVSLSQVRRLNATVAICRRYCLSECIYTHDFKTFGPVPLGLNSPFKNVRKIQYNKR